MNFEFATATKIIFGPGSSARLGALAAEMGQRALVSLGIPAGQATELLENLAGHGVLVTPYPVEGEPSIASIQGGLALARSERCDLVIGLGGGSALDTGKAIAILLANQGDLYDYLEVIGRGQPIRWPGAPYVALPTTAGTGSEVTMNAVISAEMAETPDAKVKVSLRSPLMLPRLALVDPRLTLGLPPQVTASTGLDALTQLIEPFVSNRANPLTDAICREGLRHAAGALRIVYYDGGNLAGREAMSLASLLGGLALANAKLGAVHGFAAPLGGRLSAPHGALCARLLPLVMETNLRALHERQPDHPAIRRYTEIAQILTGTLDATAEQGVEWVQAVVADLNIPGLASYGMQPADIPEMVDQAGRASSMQGNPLQLSQVELSAILEQAL
jgi:alcohol dehydrogenase class IV